MKYIYFYALLSLIFGCKAPKRPHLKTQTIVETKDIKSVKFDLENDELIFNVVQLCDGPKYENLNLIIGKVCESTTTNCEAKLIADQFSDPKDFQCPDEIPLLEQRIKIERHPHNQYNLRINDKIDIIIENFDRDFQTIVENKDIKSVKFDPVRDELIFMLAHKCFGFTYGNFNLLIEDACSKSHPPQCKAKLYADKTSYRKKIKCPAIAEHIQKRIKIDKHPPYSQYNLKINDKDPIFIKQRKTNNCTPEVCSKELNAMTCRISGLEHPPVFGNNGCIARENLKKILCIKNLDLNINNAECLTFKQTCDNVIQRCTNPCAEAKCASGFTCKTDYCKFCSAICVVE